MELTKYNSEVRAALRDPSGWGWKRAVSAGEMGFSSEQAFSRALAFIYFGFLFNFYFSICKSMNEINKSIINL